MECQMHDELSHSCTESAKHMNKVAKHIWKCQVDVFGKLYVHLLKKKKQQTIAAMTHKSKPMCV